MPKVLIDPTKGLVQSSGSGFGIAKSSESYGLYSFCKEVDLEAYTPGGADKEHIVSVCTVPASSVVTRAFIICSEDIAPNNAQLTIDLAAVSDDVDTVNSTDASDEAEIIVAAVIKDANAGDHLSSAQSSTSFTTVDLADATNILIRGGASSNTQTILTAGKFTVFVEYLGSGPATDLATLTV